MEKPVRLALFCLMLVVLFPVGVSPFQDFRTVSLTSAPDRIDGDIAGYGETRFVQGKTRKLAKDGLLHLHLPL
jgi:hypothetical protein